MEYKLNLPLTSDSVSMLKAGDIVYLSGELYTARDAAHKRITESISENKPLCIDLNNATIYYVGPTPEKPGSPIGSCGPTTSSRMDAYSPLLLDLGVKVMIGKGKRNDSVKASIVKNKALYLAAIGGAGAYLSKCVTNSEIIAYEDLGSEAIRKLTVENFPTIVVIDSLGNDLYEIGRSEYLNFSKL